MELNFVYFGLRDALKDDNCGGVVGLLVRLLPDAAVSPILVFVGLQIAAQAFLASPVTVPSLARTSASRART